MVKVYNKGTRAIVWKRGLKGTEAIHPRKYELFGDKMGEELIKKFTDACSEQEWSEIQKKRIESEKALEAENRKKAEERNEAIIKDYRLDLNVLAKKYKISFSDKTSNEELEKLIETKQEEEK